MTQKLILTSSYDNLINRTFNEVLALNTKSGSSRKVMFLLVGKSRGFVLGLL